ncbi:MAG: permease-like cell division protein FtsX [Candidatus Tagabacteria bacterium]
MFWVNVKRVFRSGFMNFWRNGWVSLATILVMIITLFVLGSLIFGRALLNSTLSQLEDKVDITVYFKTGANEGEILSMKDKLSKLDEVKEINYISAEKALQDFRERHVDNALITQSLDELAENPLGANLNIKAKDTSQYESIARFLEASAVSSIDKINFRQNKAIIERLGNILSASRNVGLGATLVLGIIAVLVAFNTIRLAIYTSKDEITVMRLVGASSRHIRGPFIVEGIMYGVFAAIFTMLIFYPLTLWLGPLAERFFNGPDLFAYYISNFFQIFAILLLTGVGLGSLSSFIATRRYLKV